MQIKVNISNLKAYQGKLERMSKSAFPIAIRETLNDCAFEYKKESLPDVWDNVMTVRHKTFLKSHSGVQKCSNTFDINKMVSVAGTLDKDLAGEQLAMHEEGGKITDRAVQTNQARVGNSINNRVRRSLRYKRFNSAVKRGRTGALIMSVADKKGIVYLLTKDGRIVSRDNSKDRNSQDAYKTIYTSKRGVIIKPNHKFNQKSAIKAIVQAPNFYEKQALRQIQKYTK